MHMFQKRLTILILLSAVAVAPQAAKAGVYADDLSRCLVEHTSDNDKVALAQWIFTVISAHPSTASMATISDSDRADTSKKTAQILQGLFLESCTAEADKAMKYEGMAALEDSFKVLGEIAMTTLLMDPTVAAESQNFIKYLDGEKLDSVFDTAAPGG